MKKEITIPQKYADIIGTGLNFGEDNRPRMQIIRGLPGTGKTTLARKYPCLHLELDQFCCRGGEYRWGEGRDREAIAWLRALMNRELKLGIDLVMSGVMPTLKNEFGIALYLAMRSHYDVWVADLAGVKGNGTIHGVRLEDQDRFARTFEPFSIDAMMKVERFSGADNEMRMSRTEDEAFSAFLKEHVKIGLMPMEYPNRPMPDGLGV